SKATAAGLAPVTVLTVPQPGPVAVAPGGSVYLAVQPTAATPARLLRSDDNGVTWTDVADATYRATALLRYRLVVDGSGAVWGCLAGHAGARGGPSPRPPRA